MRSKFEFCVEMTLYNYRQTVMVQQLALSLEQDLNFLRPRATVSGYQV